MTMLLVHFIDAIATAGALWFLIRLAEMTYTYFKHHGRVASVGGFYPLLALLVAICWCVARCLTVLK